MNNKLNDQQNKAVKTIKGPLLVFAGAGTGKTRVITYRIANMIASGIDPASILAVTFTNKAATEMKERVGKLVNFSIASKITISTFHSLGAMILRDNIQHLGYRTKFSIYDTSECASLIRKILKEEMVEIDLKYTPADILTNISKYRLSLFSNINSYTDIPPRILKYILSFFNKYLKNCNAVSFDDLIYLPIELLNNKNILDSYHEKFKYIMVDEFQDTNGPQFSLIKTLSSKHKNICVVGDDDQSIYRFRGSDYSYILNFQSTFSGTKTIKLEENYRSTKTILNAAYEVVKHNKNRKPKKLWSSSTSSDLITLIKGVDEKDETTKLISYIHSQIIQTRYKWIDVAILYRTNSQSRSLEEELIVKKIPYKIIGGTKFFERKEIKDLVAYLKLINNPFDETSLYRIINVPARGIGQTSIKKINNYCLKHNCNFFRGLNNISKIETVSSSTKNNIINFISIINKYKHAFKEQHSISNTIKCLIEEINYKTEIRKHHSKQSTIEDKYSNCMELVFSAKDFENHNRSNNLTDFLDRISLMTDDAPNKTNKQKEDKNNVVKLMTLHNSKGLEFPLVAVSGLNETILPHEKSMTHNDNIEEERRLLYVGITRAQKKLILSYTLAKSIYGKNVKLLPSRFLKEIPQNLIEDLSQPASENEIKNLFSSIKAQLSS